MTALRSTITCAGLVAIAFIISGCKIGGTPPTTSGFEAPVDLQRSVNDASARIAAAEAAANRAQMIAFGGIAFGVLGLVVGGVALMNGLSRQEAIDLAHDYDRAGDLAKYMIFDLEEPHHWPLCARKIGLRGQMSAIKEMSNQALAW